MSELIVHNTVLILQPKAKLRQHEQRTSNEVRPQFVPFGARTANDGKGENGKIKNK